MGSAHKASIGRWINEQISGEEGKSVCGGYGGFDSLGFHHVDFAKKIGDVAC
jgi:hypothetical protein